MPGPPTAASSTPEEASDQKESGKSANGRMADGGDPLISLQDRSINIFQIIPTRAGGLVYGARDGSFGALNDRGERTLFVPPAIPNFQANHEGFFLSEDGASVQFGYEYRGKSPAIFSVNERRLTDSFSILWASLKAAFTFQKPITEGLGVTDWKDSLSPKLNGKPLPMKNEAAMSLAILPDRSAFLLGTAGNLRLFDAAGKTIWRAPLHTPAYVVNTNGRWQWQVSVTGPSDGTGSQTARRSWPSSRILTESDGSSGPRPGTTTRPRGARTSSAGT